MPPTSEVMAAKVSPLSPIRDSFESLFVSGVVTVNLCLCLCLCCVIAR